MHDVSLPHLTLPNLTFCALSSIGSALHGGGLMTMRGLPLRGGCCSVVLRIYTRFYQALDTICQPDWRDEHFAAGILSPLAAAKRANASTAATFAPRAGETPHWEEGIALRDNIRTEKSPTASLNVNPSAPHHQFVLCFQ